THEQAVERIEEYTNRAVEAAVKLALRLKRLDELEKVSEMVILD
ncbi:6,7-dimethyl-8-ribityllumazine synthase, partial [Sulfolobus sp. A20-N-G8]